MSDRPPGEGRNAGCITYGWKTASSRKKEKGKNKPQAIDIAKVKGKRGGRPPAIPTLDRQAGGKGKEKRERQFSMTFQVGEGGEDLFLRKGGILSGKKREGEGFLHPREREAKGGEGGKGSVH